MAHTPDGLDRLILLVKIGLTTAGQKQGRTLRPEVAADLIGNIYEAGAFPDRWPGVLDKLGLAMGAAGGNLIRSTASHIELHSSPGVADVTREFAEQGWNERNSRVLRLLDRAGHPGFLTDSDLHTEDELAELPMYREFLNPRGVAAGAATIVQGARDDALIVALEAFESHAASREAVPVLDRMRPHMARAAVLSAEIQAARTDGLVQAFNSVGTAIGLLDQDGRLLAASDRFAGYLDDVMRDAPARLRMRDEETDRRFTAAVTQVARLNTGASIAVRNNEKIGVGVLHLLPARHDARELFSKVSIFAVMAGPANGLLPGAGIIAALYDLTPAEARVARGIAEGLSPAALAGQLEVSPETVRTHLKRVFAKTSTKRQAELSLLISRLT